ncbi:HlyD family type I secretion periplasmic adaptor subunit [Xanthobacter sp. V4C-4]|uniref:HlyD family type I secretion periplasmic adaptor subunit n=1 Tax=Xanthobacter cornucopiae TaxID=3119924 RepID=UPI00372B5122
MTLLETGPKGRNAVRDQWDHMRRFARRFARHGAATGAGLTGAGLARGLRAGAAFAWIGGGLRRGVMSAPAEPSLPGAAPPPSADYRAFARAGYGLIAFTFIGVGGWAALSNVGSAVIAPGVVGVESMRQVVQHLEGGIIGGILVKEGDEVARDQVLFRLADTLPKANYDAALAQLGAALALEARLLAERDNAGEVIFPTELSEQTDRPAVLRAMIDQITQFKDGRANFDSQIEILEGRVAQFNTEIEGLGQERQSARQQLSFVEDELGAVRELERKGLVNKSRISQLEREKARLDGTVGRNVADTAKAGGSISEIRMQIAQLRQQRVEDAGQQLLEVRQKLSDLRERVRVAQSVLERIDIRAPRAGTVQNINPRIYTVGAVVRPGDTMLEIVPTHEPLVVDAQVPVQDIDRLEKDNEVEVKFPAFHARSTPLVLGRLQSVSRDRLMNETTHEPYFLARVAVADTDIPADLKARLRPGMNAEVVFSTGDRSVLSFLVRPFTDAMSHAFTER